jgi:hypothetical protein
MRTLAAESPRSFERNYLLRQPEPNDPAAIYESFLVPVVFAPWAAFVVIAEA